MFAVLAVVLPLSAPAAQEAQKLPVPRFVSLSADEVNLRTGPGIRYPIRFIIRKEGLPVEVIREFEVWRQIRDMEGGEGWVHQSMLSGRRNVTLRGQIQTLRDKPDDDAKPVVKAEPGVIAAVEKCDTGWCRLKIASYKGWVPKNVLWGVYPDEKIED
jgi:SH3-like domain-containing protein